MTGQTTIFALSSGPPPAGIAVIRISGPAATATLRTLTARDLPPARQATVATLRDEAGAVLDRALILWFAGPASATGDDLVELHLHGGRAVVAAVLSWLARQPGLIAAQAGAFTRRAFENGRIDLTEAEGLGELLRAETEMQRKAAQGWAEGGLSALIRQWDAQLNAVAALVEAAIDFSDEDDVGAHDPDLINNRITVLSDTISDHLRDPPAERLRDGLRIVIAGRPNAGKSTLFNALVGRDAAIVSAVAGTTRDVIEMPMDFGGVPVIFADTAGLRTDAADLVEQIGIARAQAQFQAADIILALDDSVTDSHGEIIRVAAKADLNQHGTGWPVSAQTGAGLSALKAEIARMVSASLPPPHRVALNVRHRAALAAVVIELRAAIGVRDELIVAERLRLARTALGTVTGRGSVDDMLDQLFSTFCIGK
jgi:tRNA modification GTPase